IAVALIALALALVAVLPVLSRVAGRPLVVLLGLAAGDEGGQPVDIALVAALVALAALFRTAAILLFARREELGIARARRLRIAGAEGRLLAAALHRRRCARALVVAVVERLVLHVVGAMRVVAGRALGAIEIRLVLAELLLHGRDQSEIVLGVLIVVLGRHRV